MFSPQLHTVPTYKLLTGFTAPGSSPWAHMANTASSGSDTSSTSYKSLSTVINKILYAVSLHTLSRNSITLACLMSSSYTNFPHWRNVSTSGSDPTELSFKKIHKLIVLYIFTVGHEIFTYRHDAVVKVRAQLRIQALGTLHT